MKISRKSLWCFVLAAALLAGTALVGMAGLSFLDRYVNLVIGPGGRHAMRSQLSRLSYELQREDDKEARDELFEEIQHLLLNFGELEDLRTAGIRRDFNTYSVRILVVTLAVALVSICIILVTGRGFSRRLERSLGRINRVAAGLAGGDLSQHLPCEEWQELHDLSESLNRLVDNLIRADQEITREVDDRIYAEKKAIEAAKAKSAFLAHMSHEFRTPLNGILGYSQVLLMDRGLSEKNQSVVNSLKRSGESLLELINDVLDLTKIEARSMKLQQSRFYLGDLLSSLKDSYADYVAQKALFFKLSMSEDLPEDILGDQVRLRQILVNLIGNAVKFTDKGGVELRVTRVKEGIEFEVIDTGIGIAPEHQKQIFQPFMQVEHGPSRTNKGTGLGLSISGRLLDMMKSELHMESQPGKGTRFWFILPQPVREGRRLVLPTRNITGYQGPRKRILMLDPGRESAISLVPQLKKVGFEVFEPQTASQSTVDFLRTRPDIVILEANLAGESGIDCMTRMMEKAEREGLEPPPFFLLSSNAHAEDRSRGLAAGAKEVVGKPLRFLSVLELFQKHLGLEWLVGDGTDTVTPPDSLLESSLSVPVPPEPVLRQLLYLAQSGNVRKLKETAENLISEDAEWEPFCLAVLHYTMNYQMNSLVELLQRRFETQSPGKEPLEKNHETKRTD